MIRAARLRRSSDIAAVRAQGRPFRRSAFNARVRANDGHGMRVTVAAPRNLGGAVLRNRARRRVREAFRRLSARVRTADVDIVVSVRPEAVSWPFTQLLADAADVIAGAAS